MAGGRVINRIKSLLRGLLPENPFARGVSVLVGGAATGQVLLVLAGPLLTRLYSPEDFGLVAVYGSLAALIGVISSLRYELAIPLSEDDQEAANIAALCLIIIAASCILTGLLVSFLGTPIAVALGTPKLAGYLWLLPIGLLMGGVYSTFSYWNIRTKSFVTIATSGLHQTIAMLAIQLSAFKFGGVSLLVGQVFGQTMGATNLALPALRKSEFRMCNTSGIRNALFRYRRFPIFSTWEGFINSVSHQLAPLGFAALFSTNVVGLYALAHRILTLPLSLIGTAIGQVLFSTAAAAKDKDQIRALFERLSGRLAQACLPPMVILVLVAPDLFEILFGHNWRRAGEFAQWMMPWLYFQFISSPLSPIFSILEEQKQGMLWQIVLASLRGVAIFFGALVGSIDLAIIYFSVASALAYLLQVFWLGKLVGANQYEAVKQNVIAFFWAIVVGAPSIFSVIFDQSDSILICSAGSTILLCFRFYFLFKQIPKNINYD